MGLLPSAEGPSGQANATCAFPPEADADKIDDVVVQLRITVRPDGSAESVSVVADPGHGFGRVAQQCALARKYAPARDRNGTPILSSTTVSLRFSR
ncbi:Ferric siderophore transport system, periplasmic binding protein TonB [Minicystis rosea]|nr:Ferric siderophore transport system, periplasmic binding protein TonB [Minicystis rosea]